MIMPSPKWIVLLLLLALASGCGKPRTYAVDHTSGARRCVTADSFYNDGSGAFAFYLDGQPVAALKGVVAVQVVDVCKEVLK